MNEKEKMDAFFGINKSMEPKEASQTVAEQMKAMPKELLEESLTCFGLRPVKEYYQKEYEQGYICYVDAWLVRQSGGNRDRLLKIARELTGQDFTMHSMRLIRVAAISAYLESL